MFIKPACFLSFRNLVWVGVPLATLGCNVRMDIDEDGISAELDCDDEDDDMGAIAEDQDCDGILTADDCDDKDPESNAIRDDADCDGMLKDDDCDDEDASSTAIADDADCDGTLTADDCDDTRDDVYPGAPEDWDDRVDQDCDGIADVANGSCTSQMSINFPDGSSETIEGCPHWSIAASYDFDPDEPPALRAINLHLGGTEDAQFDCRIEIMQNQICDTGDYTIDGSVGDIRLVLLACSGFDAANEGEFTMESGLLSLETIDTGEDSGNFHEQPLTLSLKGEIAATLSTGISISGDFEISLTQLAESDEGEAGCAE